MSKQPPGVMVYFDLQPGLRHLTNEEKGLLLQAMLDYGQTGELPQLEGAPALVWDFVQPRLDRDRERYERVCRRNRDNARRRWEE
ncbi:MAG: hypothetical protein E7457_02720 [Ruminococcaceae bacterium]|nr:hypothetical protein [Oscillospiraceae bacterium]